MSSRAEVEALGFQQSMLKRGNCWDNVVVEGFFGRFKTECDFSGCENIMELRAVIGDYAFYYNNERGMWNKNHMTPYEYEAYLESLRRGFCGVPGQGD